MNKYLIIGAGNSAFAMASHIISNGDKVNIWNRSFKTIKELISNKTISCYGVIKGKFQVDKISTNIDDVLCDVIFVTTPASSHKDIARMLATKVTEKQIILLCPGRTFGIIEFYQELKKNGCVSLPKIVEMQTIIYTCRKAFNNSVFIYALKENVLISTIDGNFDYVMINLPDCIRKHLVCADSFIRTSLGNVGMILHCVPVLMNIGWIEMENNDFKYYIDGISQTIAKILEKLDEERMIVASKLGYELESITDWMKRTYGCDGNSLYEVIQNNEYYKEILAPSIIGSRYIEEDVPCGLVPLESVAKELGVDVSITTLFINLANIVMNKDYRSVGRNIKNIRDYM